MNRAHFSSSVREPSAGRKARPTVELLEDRTTPTTVQQDIVALYRDFLGRAGSAAEINYWSTQAVTQGQPIVSNAIVRSPESLGRIVDGVYLQVLGRVSDAGGRTAWINQLAGGQTLEQVVAAFTNSAEYASRATLIEHTGDPNADFVRSLYRGLLLRTDESSYDIITWEGKIPTLGRDGVARQFLGSAEFRADAVIGIYGAGPAPLYLRNLLHRSTPVAASDVTSWVNSGIDLLSIEVLFASSAEYLNNG